MGAVAVFFSRINLLPPNISPLGSYGFFGGSPILFFLTIFAFDFLRGGFYPGFVFTYLGFAGYPILGILAKKLKHGYLLLPAASFWFFAVSNFGVWWFWYPHTLDGLTACYLLAVPFYKNTLIGDLVFGGGYLLLKKFDYKKYYKIFVTQVYSQGFLK